MCNVTKVTRSHAGDGEDYNYLDPLQVYGVHDGALEECHRGEVTLYQTLQLQPGRGSEGCKEDDI